MSYPRDLDDYLEEELVGELTRRLKLREQGLCDYCGRSPHDSPCRYEQRHHQILEERREYRGGRRVADRLKEKLLSLKNWLKE